VLQLEAEGVSVAVHSHSAGRVKIFVPSRVKPGKSVFVP
jgi:hypothetical protein